MQRLLRGIQVRRMVIGENHRFGHRQRGDPAFLRRLGTRHHFTVEVAPTLARGKAPISSSRIRRLVLLGQVRAAAQLLGRDYVIRSTVEHGLKRGRELGFPTANLRITPNKLLPATGIYAARVDVEDRTYAGALSVGFLDIDAGGVDAGGWQEFVRGDPEVVETKRRGDAANYAAEAGDRVVIAVGGDGTAHEVVSGRLRRPSGRPPKSGFLQRGTGADLRRSLVSPRRPEDVAEWLQTDRWRLIDVGRVGTSTGRRYFINVADAGIGAEVVRRAARGPAIMGGTLNFLGGAVISLLTHR